MIKHRPTEDYADYVHRQGGKARNKRKELLASVAGNVAGFDLVFSGPARTHLLKGAVLCLGARTGAEVLAALRQGFKDSQGIDLHPVSDMVTRGDWHAIPFPDSSFPNVFSNSLDHCQSIDKLCAEVRRVLQPGGRFFFMATDRIPAKSYDEWLARCPGEFLFWDHSSHLRDGIAERGFDSVASWRSGKWGCYVLKAAKP